MHFKIDDIEVDLEHENGALRLITENDNYLLQHQTFEETEEVVTYNFGIVRSYYNNKSQGKISLTDLNQISIKIVMTYFYMYNLWRIMYKKEKNRDLKWIDKDFDNPDTNNVIISHFRKKYPLNYEAKCELLLSMSAEQFKTYEKHRDDFYNK